MSVTDPPASGPEAPADPAPAPAPASTGWPTWARRTVIGAALVVAFGILAWGLGFAAEGETDQNLDRAIVSLTPNDGAQVLRQSSVGAELRPGYDGRLTIDGIEIPEGQMDGAIDPDSVSAAELAKYGIRPNNKNRVFFTPGPGKVIEEYDTGQLTIELDYFQDELRESTERSVTWTIRVD